MDQITSYTARTGWRIPEALDRRIDQQWALERADGARETKQAFVARILEAGLREAARDADAAAS